MKSNKYLPVQRPGTKKKQFSTELLHRI